MNARICAVLGLILTFSFAAILAGCDLLERAAPQKDQPGECIAEGNGYGTNGSSDYVFSCQKEDGTSETVKLRNFRSNQASGAKESAEFQCSVKNCSLSSEIKH